MADVRLTATNPDDSSVVPVACNSKGELLITEPVIETIPNDVTVEGTLNADAVTVLTTSPGDISTIGGGQFLATRTAGMGNPAYSVLPDGKVTVRKVISGAFKGNAFMGKDTNAFEVAGPQGSVNWKVTYAGASYLSALFINKEPEDPANWNTVTRDGESTSNYTGPLIDVGAELTLLRSQVSALMEKLNMVPESESEASNGESVS